MLLESILQIANLDPCGISFVSECHKQITWLSYFHCDLFFLAVLFILSFSLPLLRKWIFLRAVVCPSRTERTRRLQVGVSDYAEAEIKTVQIKLRSKRLILQCCFFIVKLAPGFLHFQKFKATGILHKTWSSFSRRIMKYLLKYFPLQLTNLVVICWNKYWNFSFIAW